MHTFKCTFKDKKVKKVWKYMYMFRHLNEAQKMGLVNFKWSKHQKYMSNMTPHFFGNFWTTFIFGPDQPISRAWHVTRVRDVWTHSLWNWISLVNREWLWTWTTGHRKPQRVKRWDWGRVRVSEKTHPPTPCFLPFNKCRIRLNRLKFEQSTRGAWGYWHPWEWLWTLLPVRRSFSPTSPSPSPPNRGWIRGDWVRCLSTSHRSCPLP